MFARIRTALGLALLMMLALTTTALAKGNFSFIGIAGASLSSELCSSDRDLTTDWFAFADFAGGGIAAPAIPPEGGYAITRYYIDGGRESAFDQLHYYPAAGLVYYDGIVNGWSEYDRKWYAAKPQIKLVFQNALTREQLLHGMVIRKS